MAIGDLLGGIFGSDDAAKFGAQATRIAKKGSKKAEQAATEAKAAVQTGYDKGVIPFNQATEIFDPLLGQKKSVFDLYVDSLGANGPEGNQRAIDAYQRSPGYGFALDQALEGAQRNSAAAGNLNSGNTLMALSDRARELQNLDYGNWQTRLSGFDPASLYSNKAQTLTNLGNFTGNQYNNLAQTGIQGGQLGLMANQNVTGALGQQANIAGTNAAQGWGAVLGGLSGLGSFFGA